MAEAISQEVLARAIELQRQARAQEAAQRAAEAAAAADLAAKTETRSLGQFGQDVGLQLLQGAVGLGQAAYGVGNLGTLGVLDRVTGFSEDFQETGRTLSEAKSPQTQYAQQQAQQVFDNQGVLAGVTEYATTPALLQDLLVSNAASIIPAAATGRAAAGVASQYATARGLTESAAQRLVADRAEQAVLRTVAGQVGGSTNIEAINQIRDAGGTANEQQVGGVAAGLIAGVAAPAISKLTGAARFEAAAANALPGGVGSMLPGRGLIAGALTGGVREGTEEYAQSGTEQLAQNLVTPGKDLWDGVGQQAALGALAGTALGGTLGGYMGATTPRASASTPLGQTIRSMLGTVNRDLDAPLQQSALLDPVIPSPLVTSDSGPMEVETVAPGDTPLPGELPLAAQLPEVEEINFADTALPNLPRARVDEVQVEEIMGAPAPLRSLYDITGRRPRVGPEPTMGVEELPPAPLTGALAAIQAQRTRGQLGGTDLFAGPLPAEGAFPAAEVTPYAAPTPAPVSPAQAPLDFNAEPPTWKRALAKELGLKPASFRGKSWDQFVAAAEAAGVRPYDANANEFLSGIATQLAADPATTPMFAAKLAEKYRAQPAPTAATGTLEDALALTEDEYIKAVNPTGKTSDPEDVVNVRVGDLDLPATTELVTTTQDRTGIPTEIRSDAAGNMYAVQNGEVVGQIELQDGETLNIVAQEAQGRGIGSALATEFVRRNPFAPAGSFSPAGEAARRSAFRQLKAEADSVVDVEFTPAPTLQEARAQLETENAAVVDRVAASRRTTAWLERQAKLAAARELANGPPQVQQGATPGSPSEDNVAPPVGIDQNIAKYARLDPSATLEQNTADAYMDLLADATNVDVLDETFIAIKNHAGWKTLSDEQQTEIAEEFDIRYSRVEGGDPGKFQRVTTKVADPIPTQQFTQLVAAANRGRGPNDPAIVPIEDAAQYELISGRAAPQDAAGVFVDGTIYLIRQNIATPEDLALTLTHERGHQGLSVLLGSRLPAVMNRLWTNAATRERIKGKMKALAGNVDPTKEGGLRRLAAEEVLADMLANGEKVNGDIVTKVRSGIETFFANLLGYGDLKLSNASVDALLRDVGAVLRGSSPATLNASEPDHLRGLVDLMGDPASTVLGDARYSRTLGELDVIVAAADAEGAGTRKTLNDVAKNLGQAGLDTVKNLGSSVSEGGVFGTLLDATPLNQLVNLYGKSFTSSEGSLLSQYARLKRGKESAFNKSLTQPGELTYRSQAQKINTSPLDLTKQWETFQRKSPAKADALNKLQQFSTLYRLWPDSTWDQQSKLNYNEQSFTESERKEALVDLQRLWKSIGTEGQDVFRSSQAVYSSTWGKRFAALRAELSRATGLDVNSPQFKQAFGNTIDSAMGKLNTGPYSPLQRYGDYLVTVRDAQGKIAWFSGHDTKAQADAQARQLAESDFRREDQFQINTTARQSHDWQLDGISAATVANLEKIAIDALPAEADSALREEVRRALVEAYLQSLPQQSFLQHANKRKGVAGFTTDAFRAFNDYSIKASRSIASLQYDGQISSKLNELQSFVSSKTDEDTTKRQRVLNAVKSQHTAAMNFERSPTADALSQAGFIFFLTSPSQLFINSMQTPMVTLPRLAGTYGNSASIKAIKNALGSFVKSRGDMLGDKSVLAPGSAERRVLDQLHQRGVLDFTLAHDMTGLANGEASAMSGHWRRVMEVASVFMHRSEVFNRQVTALATARLELDRLNINPSQATDAQIAQLADAAEESVLTTQFDYSQSNKPKLLQGPWRKVIFQFQQYRLNMLAMMAKDIRDGFIATDASPEEKSTARRALAWMLGMQLAITGAAGTVLAPFVFAIADMFRDDEDLLDSRTEFTRATPQWLAHGILAGALDTQRLGADSLIPILGDRSYAPKDATAKETFQYYVMANIGPWAGLLGGATDGVAKAMNGDMVGAAKGLMPAPIRDFYKSVYESQAGARDSRQVVYFEPGVWDTVSGAMGLRSGERRSAETLRNAGFQASQQANTSKQRYLGRLALGHATGDQDMIAEAMDGIQSWNAAHPDLAIRATDVKRAIINRVRAQDNATAYGLPSARPPSESIKQALAL